MEEHVKEEGVPLLDGSPCQSSGTGTTSCAIPVRVVAVALVSVLVVCYATLVPTLALACAPDQTGHWEVVALDGVELRSGLDPKASATIGSLPLGTACRVDENVGDGRWLHVAGSTAANLTGWVSGREDEPWREKWTTLMVRAANETRACPHLGFYSDDASNDAKAHNMSGTDYSDLQLSPAPAGFVFAQQLWNAAVVAQLVLLLLLSAAPLPSRREAQFRVSAMRWIVGGAWAVCVVLLPFSHYVGSPGGHVLAATALACAIGALRKGPATVHVHLIARKPRAEEVGPVPYHGATIVARGDPVRRGCCSCGLTVELLGFMANLLSMLYNGKASKGTFPYWFSLWQTATAVLGLNAESRAVAKAMYNVNGAVPAYIPLAYNDNDALSDSLFQMSFTLIWTVLPFIYVLYFAVMAAQARSGSHKKCCTAFQVALSLCGVVHFLFITDLVDYAYGRGFSNPAAGWGHWSEKFVWRIAILLPIYQSATKNGGGWWINGHAHRILGIVLHYVIVAYCIIFAAYSVVGFDIYNFIYFVLDHTSEQVQLPATSPWWSQLNKKLGPVWAYLFGYHGALLIMTILYGASIADPAMPVTDIRITAGPPGEPQDPEAAG